jgi:hypothetical protein
MPALDRSSHFFNAARAKRYIYMQLQLFMIITIALLFRADAAQQDGGERRIT